MQRTTTVGLDIAKSVFQDDQLSKCCWRQDKWGTNSARRRITFEWTRLALTSSFSLLTTAVGRRLWCGNTEEGAGFVP